MGIEQLASAFKNPLNPPYQGEVLPKISKEEWEKNRGKEEKQNAVYAFAGKENLQNLERESVVKKGEEERKKYSLGGVEGQAKKALYLAKDALLGAGISLKNALALLHQEEELFREEEQKMAGKEGAARKAQLSGEAEILFARYNQREGNRNTGEIQNA